MRLALICESHGVHEDRFQRAFIKHGHEAIVVKVDEALGGGQGLAKYFGGQLPDLAIGGPLHRGDSIVELLGDVPYVAVSYAYDVLLEARKSPGARAAVIRALRRCRGLIADCQAVLHEVAELLDGACPPSINRPWGLDQGPSSLSGEELKVTQDLFDRFARRAVRAVVISVRNWTELHGADLVLQAFLSCTERHSDIGLLLAGDGPLRPRIESMRNQSGLEDRIILAGKLTEGQVMECLARADIYISASAVDGTSVSLLQALHSGIPVILTRVGGNEEWASLATGCKLAAAHSADALARAMEDGLREWDGTRFDRKSLMDEKCDWRKNGREIVRFCEDLSSE